MVSILLGKKSSTKKSDLFRILNKFLHVRIKTL